MTEILTVHFNLQNILRSELCWPLQKLYFVLQEEILILIMCTKIVPLSVVGGFSSIADGFADSAVARMSKIDSREVGGKKEQSLNRRLYCVGVW